MKLFTVEAADIEELGYLFDEWEEEEICRVNKKNYIGESNIFY